MPLQGTFDVLDFTEVLRLLGRRGVTGRLHLRSRAMTANLFFEDGALVGADQSDHQAAAAAGDVRSRLEEVCFGLLEADRGTFEFQPGRATALPGAVRLKVDTVLVRARKRLDEWRVLVERVPSLDVHPHVVTDLDVSEVTLDKERWRMLTAIDGRRNLRAIGRTLNLSDFDACRILVGLIDAGVADLDDLSKATAGNRDLVPTIPLPEGMAETAAAGPARGDDVESVTISRGARRTDDEKRAATKAATVGAAARSIEAQGPGHAHEEGSDDGPEAPRREPTADTEGPTGRRRARRRTPGGGAANAPVDEAPTVQTGGDGDAGTEPEARRPRRVVRIGSRAQTRPS